MPHEFCPGYPSPYDQLTRDYPDVADYPADAFRVEWGPMFHRGRLDGTARVLILGQDPAEEETFARRILVGVAGQRTQGLLTRLKVDHDYVMVNTFLYSVTNQRSGAPHVNDTKIKQYRHDWLDTIATHNPGLTAIVTLGNLAHAAYATWHTSTTAGQACTAHHAPIEHPTADSHPTVSTAQLLQNWNAALPALYQAVNNAPGPQKLYGSTFTATDLTAIPERDLPPGLPTWTQSLEPWATRGPGSGDTKRATLTLTVPPDQRPWKTP